MKYKKETKKDIVCYVLIGIIVIAFIRAFGCPIKFMTGISCPGCGMTRACISVLKGDFVESLKYHPMIVVMPIFAILFVCTIVKQIHNKYMKIIDKLWVTFGMIFIITYVIRLFMGESDIVTIDIRNSVILKIIPMLCV